MRSLIFLLLFSSQAFGAFYIKNDGTGAPIETYDRNVYLGPNLMPGVVLPYVNLDSAIMHDADLKNSIITFDGNFIELHNSNFSNATVTILPSEYIELYGSNFFNAEININSNHLGLGDSNFQNTRGSLYSNDADLGYSNFSNSNVNIFMYGGDASFVNFSYSDLTGSVFDYTLLDGANFDNANLESVHFINMESGYFQTTSLLNATYNDQTIFPENFDPVAAGMIFVSEVPLPAGIYLFLSGLVGLGLIRGRNA
tara:strand:- start:323 stop:1087 length:765 start_codon:yes stop_codon:yes gene_type:complete